MKIDDLINEEQNLEEMSSLINFIGSIAKKYHTKVGNYEMRVAINKYMAEFSRMLSRYNTSWSKVNMFLIYHYFRTRFNLNDSDIIDVVNTGTASEQLKRLSANFVIDSKKTNLLASILKNKKPDDNYIHGVFEQIMSAAILRATERHDEMQAGVNPHGKSPRSNKGNNGNQTTTQTAQTTNSPTTQQSQPTQSHNAQNTGTQTPPVQNQNSNVSSVNMPVSNPQGNVPSTKVSRTDVIKSKVFDILNNAPGSKGIEDAIQFLQDEKDRLNNKPAPTNSVNATRDANGNWNV